MGRSWRTVRGGGNSARYCGYRPPMAGGRVGMVSVAVLAALLAACSGGGSDTTASSRTTTTTPPARTATVVGETVVSNAYRQGVAKTADGWIFSLNNALFRTDDAFNEKATKT